MPGLPLRRALALLLWTLVVGAATGAVGQPQESARDAEQKDERAQRPNVILVVTDDQGYGDLSCHGNPVLKTPHLDALAQESTRFLDYHVAPTCSPTRSALLTGHWTNRTGVWHTINGRSMLRRDEVTLGELFQEAGYATGMFGKWHLGDNAPFRPEDRGFGEVLRHGGGGVGQTPDRWDNAYFGGSYFASREGDEGGVRDVDGYCTDVFFDAAKDFIRAQKKAERPFLAYIATNAPHGPFHAPPESSKPFLDAGLALPLANFLGMIANIDDNVGALRAFLDDQGLTRDTIFIFTTDNGTAAGNQVHAAGMRGKKGSAYDGGHRVPLFLHWPGGGLRAGREVEPIAGHVDVVPTLLDLAGIEAPEGLQFDGRSLRPLMEAPEGEGAPADWPDRILVTDSQRVRDPIRWRRSAVMTSDWRLVSDVAKGGEVTHELYAIKNDPAQKTNVIAEHPEVFRRLADFYLAWWTELEPTFGEPARIDIGGPLESPTRLTSHDWITNGSVPWNQGHVRRGVDRPSNTGFWNLRVARAGRYAIELRRWPDEGAVASLAITDPLPPGDAVPGVKAYRMTPGRAIPAVKATIEIGGRKLELPVPEEATSVRFTLHLKEGPAELKPRFHGAEGEVTGAYYAYVTRLGGEASSER